jgi:hypothetical protein
MGQSFAKDRSGEMLLTVPAPFQFESPSSWLTRAALTQGVTPTQLGGYFGVGRLHDFDLTIHGRLIQKITSKSTLHSAHFEFMRVMFQNLNFVDRMGQNLLLSDSGAPRYRYCSVCLYEQSVKHFPVHWRFKPWRYCPLHTCLMEDHCRHCASPIVLPVDLINAGPSREGVAFLHHCLRCGKPLSSHWSSVRGELYRLPLSTNEKALLPLGRAVLSGLYALENCRESLLKDWFEIYFIRDIEAKRGLHQFFEMNSSELYSLWQRREKKMALGALDFQKAFELKVLKRRFR